MKFYKFKRLICRVPSRIQRKKNAPGIYSLDKRLLAVFFSDYFQPLTTYMRRPAAVFAGVHKAHVYTTLANPGHFRLFLTSSVNLLHSFQFEWFVFFFFRLIFFTSNHHVSSVCVVVRPNKPLSPTSSRDNISIVGRRVARKIYEVR